MCICDICVKVLDSAVHSISARQRKKTTYLWYGPWSIKWICYVCVPLLDLAVHSGSARQGKKKHISITDFITHCLLCAFMSMCWGWIQLSIASLPDKKKKRRQLITISVKWLYCSWSVMLVCKHNFLSLHFLFKLANISRSLSVVSLLHLRAVAGFDCPWHLC